MTPVNRSQITAELASGLITDQFPQWADMPVCPVDLAGWDNVTFRLGDSMPVRLPSGEGYVPQVAKEHRWLPVLAAQLPLPIPVPLAQGAPGRGYSWPWSVYRWLDGEPAETGPVADMTQFAAELAEFLSALYRISPEGGPQAGYDTCYFGVPLEHWDSQTREAIRALGRTIDGRRRFGRGHEKKAATATAHTLLCIAWAVMKYDADYAEAGADYYDQRDARNHDHLVRHHQQALARLGYQVTLTPPGDGSPPPAQAA